MQLTENAAVQSNKLPEVVPFYRPRFLVVPTGRLIFAWGIWDTEKFPLAAFQCEIPAKETFVSRHKNLGRAHREARRLNNYERKQAA